MGKANHPGTGVLSTVNGMVTLKLAAKLIRQSRTLHKTHVLRLSRDNRYLVVFLHLCDFPIHFKYFILKCDQKRVKSECVFFLNACTFEFLAIS